MLFRSKLCWAQHQGVVVFMCDSFYDTCTIISLFKPYQCFAATSFAHLISLSVFVSDRWLVVAFTHTFQVPCSFAALPYLDSKARVLRICVVEIIYFFERAEFLANDWYQMGRELWCLQNYLYGMLDSTIFI